MSNASADVVVQLSDDVLHDTIAPSVSLTRPASNVDLQTIIGTRRSSVAMSRPPSSVDLQTVALLVVERDLHRSRALEEAAKSAALHFELDALRKENARLRAVLGESRPSTPSAAANSGGGGARSVRSRAESAVSTNDATIFATFPTVISPPRDFIDGNDPASPNSPNVSSLSPTNNSGGIAKRASFRGNVVPFGRPLLQPMESGTLVLTANGGGGGGGGGNSGNPVRGGVTVTAAAAAVTIRAPTSLLSSFFSRSDLSSGSSSVVGVGGGGGVGRERRERANTAPQPVSPSRTKAPLLPITRPRAASQTSAGGGDASMHAEDSNQATPSVALASFLDLAGESSGEAIPTDDSAASLHAITAAAAAAAVTPNSHPTDNVPVIIPSRNSFLSAFVAPRAQINNALSSVLHNGAAGMSSAGMSNANTTAQIQPLTSAAASGLSSVSSSGGNALNIASSSGGGEATTTNTTTTIARPRSGSGAGAGTWTSWFTSSSSSSSSLLPTTTSPSVAATAAPPSIARGRSLSLPRSVASPPPDNTSVGVFVDDAAATALAALAASGNVIGTSAAALTDALVRDAALPRADAVLLSRVFLSVPRFAILDARERAKLALAFSRVHYAQGDVVAEGGKGGLEDGGFFVAVEGRLSSIDGTNSITSFNPGDCFATDALSPGARVIAASDSTTVLNIRSPLLTAMLLWFEHARELEQRPSEVEGSGGITVSSPIATLAGVLSSGASAIGLSSNTSNSSSGTALVTSSTTLPPPLPPPFSSSRESSPLARLRRAVAGATDFISYGAALRRHAGAAHALTLPASAAPRGGAGPAGARELEQAMRDLEREPCIFLQGEAITLGGRGAAARFLQDLASVVRAQVATDADFCESLVVVGGYTADTNVTGGGGEGVVDVGEPIESAREATVAAIVADIAVGVSRTVHGGDSFVAAHELLTHGGLVFLAAETGAQPPAEVLVRGARASISAVNVYRAAHMEPSAVDDEGNSGGGIFAANRAGVAVWARLRCTVREEIQYSIIDVVAEEEKRKKKVEEELREKERERLTRGPTPPPPPPPAPFAFSGFLRGFSRVGSGGSSSSSNISSTVASDGVAGLADTHHAQIPSSHQVEIETVPVPVVPVVPVVATETFLPPSSPPTVAVKSRLLPDVKTSALRWLDIVARVLDEPERG